MEVGFAQKAKFQTKDGTKTTQKVEDANSKKQQALKKQKALQKESAKTLPSVQQLQKSWKTLSEREQLALMKEIMLNSAANSPQQKFVESKVGATKMQEIGNKAKAEAIIKKQAEESAAHGGTVELNLKPGVAYNRKKMTLESHPEILLGSKEDNFRARREFEALKTQDPATGKIPDGIREKSIEFARALKSNLDGNSDPSFRTGAPLAAGDQTSPWLKRGPYNVGGRTRALAFDVRDENILLAGGVSGGMWRSTDQGATWVRVTTLDEHPSVTDIVQDPINNDTWYYSTGERPGNSASGGGAFFQGNGIYKSTDNGLTWESLIATTTGTPQSFDGAFDLIWELAINPLNSDLYVSTYFGIFRSSDGGASFDLVLPGEFDSDSYVAVTSTGVLYASVSGTGTAGEEGIYRSLTGDNGDWVDISAGSGFPTGRPRTVLGIAPSNEDMVYLLTAAGGVWKYTYLSGDGAGAGGTWEDRSANLPNFGGTGLGDFNPQGGYNLFITVHPNDPDMVFMLATDLYRSTDGYSSSANTAWIGGYTSDPNEACCTLYTNSHPDHHRLVFFNSDPNKAIKATDGGVALTNDITASNANIEQVTWISLNNGYYTTQPYAGSIGPGDQIMAGFQDNSTWFESTTDSTADWAELFGGDGAYNAFNADGTLRYVSFQGGNMFRQSFADADSDIPLTETFITPTPNGGSLFITPFIVDENDQDIMYFAGSDGLWRNTDLPNATTTNGWTNLGGPAGISAIATSTIPANVVYFGNSTGALFRIDDATGAAPLTSINAGLPSGYISGISVDEYDANHVVVVLSNYSIPSIFESRDAGATWTDISGNLEENVDGTGTGPSVQSIALMGNEDVYVVGTSTGVYTAKTINGDLTVWTPAPELGSVPVPHLARRNSDGLVLASTHGNGLWSANFETTVPRIIQIGSIDNVEAKVDDAPVVVDLSGVFDSNATPADVITLSVANNTNMGLVTTAIVGTDLTLTFVAGMSGTATITIDANDTDTGFASASFEVTVVPVVSAFPYAESFESGAGDWSGIGSWALGQPNAAIIVGASDGTEAWTTNLTGEYPSGEQSFVLSPYFDFSGLANPFFSFDIWYDIESLFDGASLQYTTDEGQTWVNVGAIGTGDNWYTASLIGFAGATPALDWTGGTGEAWTGNGTNGIDGTGGYVTASQFLPMLAGESCVRFRVAFGSDGTVTDDGFAFDNISIVDIQDDLGVFAIQLAEFGKFGAAEEVTVTFENFGLNDIAASALTASIEVDGAVAVANEAITVAIPAGSSVDFTFVGTIDLSAAGDHDVRVFLDTPDDFVANDTTEAGLLNVPLIATYPYNESFEGDDGFWYSTDENGNNTWAHGSPNGFVIDDAADGTEAWVTNLDGAYVDSEQSFLNSVFFDFTAVANPVVSFNIWYDTENGFDGVSFQSSTDEGQTWTNVGTIGDGFNWYNGDIGATMAFSGGNGEAWNGGNGGWETAQILVPSLAGESCVQFRVVMGSDALFFFANGFDGVGIDNVTVTDLTDDLAIVGLAMEDAAVYGATSAIKVAVINNGVNDATNFEISYDVDGTGPVTETFAGPIAPGVTDTLIFTTTADLSVLGDHTLDIEIVTADDLLNNNSGSFDLFTLDFIVAAPYLENFETDPTIESGELGKWFDTAESDFAWTINSGSTTSGATGPDDDHSEPGENYIYTEASGSNEGDVAKLYTPGIDVTGFLHPTMSFWYHRFGSDLGDLEVILHDVAADTYTTVATLTGESQFDNGDDFVFSGYVPVDITGDQFSVIFRGTRGDGFNGDMTIDDFEVFDIVDNDLAIFDAEIINPFVPGQEPVIAYITNNGFQPQSNFDVTYTINGVGTVTDNIAGPLESGQTIEHTFSIDADVSAAGQSFDFAIFTSLPGDELVSNDTFAYNFTHPGIVDVYPYVESFETGNGGWRDISASLDGIPSSWELGMPIATVIDTASDGVNAWVTNLDGDYENSEESFVVGPVFDFTTIAEPVVLMDAWFESEEAFDGSSMQYSIDSGVTWVNIGLVGDRVNWYNLNLPDAGGFFGGNQLAFTGGNGDAWSRDGFGTYEIVSHEIFDLAGEATVLLRINFGSDGTITQEGMAFDRFRVVERTDLVTLTCAEDVEVPTDAGDDIATSVTIEAPAINNGVGTEVLTNDWTGTDDASGDFLAGYTELNWLVVGEEFADECTQLVLVVDEELPELTDCPTDTAFLVDTYLDSVMYSFDDPMISDNLEILTYSADQTLINRTEVMCPVAENGFLRIFDFEEDFATDADMIHVSGIEVGISNAQSISGTQPAVINIHTYDADLDLDPANFNLVYTDTIDMPDGNVFFFELPAGVDVPADLSLVAEVVTFGNFNFADYFMVASQPNQDRSGSTNSYIRADACGLADLDDFAFTGYEWVINLQVAPVLELDGIESGNNFGIGTNTQTYTAYDAYGNEVECEFDVDIVVDSIVVLDPTNITPTTFQANWGTVPGGKSYELEVIQVGTGIVVYTETVIGDNFAVVDAGLDDAFTYVYRVRANSGKIYTSFSDIMPVIFAPHTPVALTATDIDVGAFNSNWQSGGDNKFSTYTVELSNDDFATILDQEEVNNVTLTHRFTPGEGTYKYRVRATRETKWNDSTLIIMSEYSNMIEVVTLPNAPSNLTATASDIGSAAAVTLDWTDNSSTEVFFIVEKAVAGTGNFVPLLNADGTVLMLPADTETYVDMEVTALVTYAYRVVAIATDGSRSESNIAVSSIVSGTVDELLETSTTVSPNPSNAIFNLRMDNEYNGDLTFEIFDVVGKVIDRQEYKKSNVSFLREIDLGKVQSGIYLLRISSENGFITRRLVKQ